MIASVSDIYFSGLLKFIIPELTFALVEVRHHAKRKRNVLHSIVVYNLVRKVFVD